MFTRRTIQRLTKMRQTTMTTMMVVDTYYDTEGDTSIFFFIHFFFAAVICSFIRSARAASTRTYVRSNFFLCKSNVRGLVIEVRVHFKPSVFRSKGLATSPSRYEVSPTTL
jgi:hypothetical protein